MASSHNVKSIELCESPPTLNSKNVDTDSKRKNIGLPPHFEFSEETDCLVKKLGESKAQRQMIEEKTVVRLRELEMYCFNRMLDTVDALARTCHLVIVDKKFDVNNHNQQQLANNPSVSLDSLMEGDSSRPRSPVSLECINCLLYLSTLFPQSYEIEKDTMIQLWMAEGLIQGELMEHIASAYVYALCYSSCISYSRRSQTTGKLWYKVNQLNLSQEMLSRMSHLTLNKTDTPSLATKCLSSCIKMKTLLILPNHDPHATAVAVERIPYDFFTSSMRLLTVLSLTETRISEIPSSIGNLKDLRYLDLSNTLIKQLPQTIIRLQHLQTLKLQSCPLLYTLPKYLGRITSLRHLDLGTTCHLHSMPFGMGELTSLRTLSHFLVGSGFRCNIGELKNLNNLRGYLCLSRLQNVSNPKYAMETKLCHKRLLRKLELKWCPRQQVNDRPDHDVLQSLQPHTNLQDLSIHYYGDSMFPRWIFDPSFKNLSSITLIKCENCSFLPPLGRLPQLESLEINGLNGIRTLEPRLFGGFIDEKLAWFPSLKKLKFSSMLNLEGWENVRRSQFPNLHNFIIRDCPKLTNLCNLSEINSLTELEISACPLLPSLPEGCLPSSVEKLVIEDCPLLKTSCSKPNGRDWDKIKNVGSVWIDYENVSTLSVIDVKGYPFRD